MPQPAKTDKEDDLYVKLSIQHAQIKSSLSLNEPITVFDISTIENCFDLMRKHIFFMSASIIHLGENVDIGLMTQVSQRLSELGNLCRDVHGDYILRFLSLFDNCNKLFGTEYYGADIIKCANEIMDFENAYLASLEQFKEEL